MRGRIISGEEWYGAMLQAVRHWPLEEEELDGEWYVYLIAQEALDLARLYERLSLEIADLVAEDELLALIADGRSPLGHSSSDLKEAIGADRYAAYLSFIYGVLVEEMVVHAVVSDLRKRHRTAGLMRYDAELDDAYLHVYGSNRADLLALFRRERGLPRRNRISLTEMKEFTYWLFKLRLRGSDKSRVASDTKRALTVLHRYTASRGMTRR